MHRNGRTSGGDDPVTPQRPDSGGSGDPTTDFERSHSVTPPRPHMVWEAVELAGILVAVGFGLAAVGFGIWLALGQPH